MTLTLPLQPFVALGDGRFDGSVEALVARLGPPRRFAHTAVALNEYDYGDCVYRFQDSGRLEEITMRAPVLQIARVAIPFAALGGFVREQDAEAFERAGFLVSPAFGIAFVPGEPDWVTALARHCIPTWRAMS